MEGTGADFSSPEPVEISGLPGLKMIIDGIVGQETGQPLAGAAVVLFEEEASYLLLVQYELEDRDPVLSDWLTVLDSLDIATSPQS